MWREYFDWALELDAVLFDTLSTPANGLGHLFKGSFKDHGEDFSDDLHLVSGGFGRP